MIENANEHGRAAYPELEVPALNMGVGGKQIVQILAAIDLNRTRRLAIQRVGQFLFVQPRKRVRDD